MQYIRIYNIIINSIIITRPINCIIAGVSIFFAGYIANNYQFNYYHSILLALAGSFVTAAGNIINDIFDIEIDKINRPLRPLPSKKISITFAYILYFSFVTLSIFLSSTVNIYALGIVIISNITIFFYSYKLKSIALVGNFTVSFFTALSFIYGGLAGKNIKLVFLPAFFAFLVNFIREIVKDCEDIEGDTALGMKTFPILFGNQSSTKLLLALNTILIASCVYLFYLKLNSIIAAVLVIFIIFLLIFVHKNIKNSNFHKSSSLLKIIMILGIISFIIN
jgi:geranylgeranylglycerol-phosphate geranylgeranyltransferase